MYDEYSTISDSFEPRNSFPIKPASIYNVPVPSVSSLSISSDELLIQPINTAQKINQQNDHEPYSSWQREDLAYDKPEEPRRPILPSNYNHGIPNIQNQQHFNKSDSGYNGSSQLSSRLNQSNAVNKKTNKVGNNFQSPKSGSASLPEYNRTDRQQNYNHSLPLPNQSQPLTQNISPIARYENVEPRSQMQQNFQEMAFKHPGVSVCENVNRPVNFREQSHIPQNVQQECQKSSPRRLHSPVNQYKYYSPNTEKNQNTNRTRSPNYCQKNYGNFSNNPVDNCKIIDRYPQNACNHQSPMYDTDPHPHYHSHHHNVACCGGNSNSENSETVRNLLMLVNSYSEQIKSLQIQIDRLFKLHEDNMKERRNCTCSQNKCNTKSDRHFGINSNSDDIRLMEDKSLSNVDQDGAVVCRKTQEDPKNAALVKQKVSIGVMTSFELTVQNSQHLADADDEENVEDLRDKTKRCAYQDTFDTRKKQTPISRKPSCLENINEDTESHLSSHPRSNNTQNSSNFRRQTPDNGRPIDMNYQRLYQNENSTNSPYRTMNSHAHEKNLYGNYNEMSTPRNFNVQDENYMDQRHRIANMEDNIYSNEHINNRDDENRGLKADKIDTTNRNSPNVRLTNQVEMQHSVSDESIAAPAKHTPNVGWTLYSNVLGQVNQILRNSPLDNNAVDKTKSKTRAEEQKIDRVKAATLEQFSKMGISFHDNEGSNSSDKKSCSETPYFENKEMDLNMAQGLNPAYDTNTSMKMKALALKYLSDDQISSFAIQRNEAWKQLMMSNIEDNNFSLATIRYLKKYQLLPGVPNNPEGIIEAETENFRKNEERQTKPKIIEDRPILGNGVNVQKAYNNKILDITALKKLPKLH